MATSDEQFHEFHLDGKQMFFLFMASLVVAVVIFLCGVMVGRGVRAPRVAASAEASVATILDPTAPPEPPAASGVILRENGGTPPAEDLTYTARLESPSPSPETLREREKTLRQQQETQRQPPETLRQPQETLRQPQETLRQPQETARQPPEILREPEPPEPPTSAPLRAGPSQAPPRAATALLEPAGNGYVVQVMSVTQLEEAERVARGLVSKGYPAFVSLMPEGGQSFRVRVGKYADRRQAESIANRLEKQEKFKKPWVTR